MSKFDMAFALIPSICFITNGETIEETNNAFLSFFQSETTEAFLQEHRCICNLFEPRDGFLQKQMGELSWITYVLKHPELQHKVMIRQTIFSLIANAYTHEQGTSYVVLMQKLDEEELSQGKLLEQYKHVVDRSAVVSKTDKYGKITYINDRFCEITSYTADELLGKQHNIVRHPDMPAETFAQMWKTIQAKQPWYGIIKNRRKDGSSYYVDSVINPIVDCNGEIIEFIAVRYDVTHLETMKNNLYDELEETQKELIYRLGEISESRSLETGNHVKRVAEYSKLLALRAGLSPKETSLLHLASPMHDIGKIGIPDHVLHKAHDLDHDEWQIMKSHCEKGYDLLKASERPILKAAAIVAHQHHEKYDGTGYPRGLQGREIHIFGRITALADVFDALGSHRSYKTAWSDEKIFSYFKAQSGKQFDPELVDVFFENVDQFLQIRNAYDEHLSPV